MPLSTFNFDHKVPAGKWMCTWLGCLVLVVAGTVSLEVFWRSQGHQPEVIDDIGLWSNHRAKVYKDNTVVLVGDSRMLYGFSTQQFQTDFPECNLVNLAVAARAAAATLIDLAEDENFSGTIVCAMTPAAFEPYLWDRQKEYVENYHNYFKTSFLSNYPISSQIQQRLVFISPRVNTKSVLFRLIKNRQLPAPVDKSVMKINKYRSRLVDSTKIKDLEDYRQKAFERDSKLYDIPHTSPDQWLVHAMEIDSYVQKILKRGGKVVFVRFPTTGKLFELEQEYFPRQQYWDRFAQLTCAETIYFSDYPELSAFECYDYSHLDYRDAILFTKGLGKLLLDRNVLQASLAKAD